MICYWAGWTFAEAQSFASTMRSVMTRSRFDLEDEKLEKQDFDRNMLVLDSVEYEIVG